ARSVSHSALTKQHCNRHRTERERQGKPRNLGQRRNECLIEQGSGPISNGRQILHNGVRRLRRRGLRPQVLSMMALRSLPLITSFSSSTRAPSTSAFFFSHKNRLMRSY